VQILPLGDEIDVASDATLMGGAQALGYYWPTTCGGEGRCTTCACEVTEGASMLSGRGKSEEASLVYERGERVLSTNVRLACQARVLAGASDGTIVVRKPGVRRPV
jgi:2Fe-2S ferredoxin